MSGEPPAEEGVAGNPILPLLPGDVAVNLGGRDGVVRLGCGLVGQFPCCNPQLACEWPQ
jgi:hypothetical protein